MPQGSRAVVLAAALTGEILGREPRRRKKNVPNVKGPGVPGVRGCATSRAFREVAIGRDQVAGWPGLSRVLRRPGTSG